MYKSMMLVLVIVHVCMLTYGGLPVAPHFLPPLVPKSFLMLIEHVAHFSNVTRVHGTYST